MQQAEAKRVIEAIRINVCRLDHCFGPHDFQPTPETKRLTIGIRYRCTICLGEVDSTKREWYRRGLAHGAAK